MKDFVIGFIDYFDNILTLELIGGDNALDAAKKFLKEKGFDTENINTLQELQSEVFNCDANFSILEI